MRVLFPNVEAHLARGVEIMARTPMPLQPHQEALKGDDAEALGLRNADDCATSLQLPVYPRARSWAVGWKAGLPPNLNGPSGQLAALIAKVAALGRSSGVRPRGWLADAATEVWATGALERSDELGEFLVAPVGMDDDGALTLKFRAFVEAGAPLFICASEDAAALEEAAKIESVRSVTVDALRRYANRARPQTLLVGVQPGECRALLDALFRGMFPRNAGFLVANAITLSRLLVFAPVAIWSVVHDDQVGAFFWYSGGLLTDVLDGFIARYAHGTSEFGKRFDRLVDMAFNVSVIATIGILAVTAGRVAGAIGLLAATFGPVLVTRLMGVKPPGSAIAKLRSGWIRVAVLGYVVLGVDWSAISGRWIAGAVVIGLFLLGAAAYEIRETIREVRLGRRGWFTLGK